jgi:hypothetical protein
MTVEEAGRRGGRATAAAHADDPGYYVRLGSRGNAAWLARSTREERAAVGRSGGEATRDRHGPEHYRTIGRRGGERVKLLFGLGYYAAIARRRTAP